MNLPTCANSSNDTKSATKKMVEGFSIYFLGQEGTGGGGKGEGVGEDHRAPVPLDSCPGKSWAASYNG